MKVLVADDDRQILRALRIILAAQGHEVLLARDGREAIDGVASGRPDVVLVDLGMPGIDGFAVIQAVRGWSSVPILVVSGRGDSAEKVRALDLGADDYVTKPFATDELLARIRALGRRAAPDAEGEEAVVRFADITVDLRSRTVVRTQPSGETLVRLTPTEWKLLEVLVRNPDRVLTREMILTEIWGPAHQTDGGYLRLYISQLRKKLEPEPSKPVHLVTEPGMGYRFVPGASAQPDASATEHAPM